MSGGLPLALLFDKRDSNSKYYSSNELVHRQLVTTNDFLMPKQLTIDQQNYSV